MFYVIAGKEEGFSFTEAKIVPYEKDKGTMAYLRSLGYTQFVFTLEVGYEYTLGDGSIIQG